jgi:hypothetical protein
LQYAGNRHVHVAPYVISSTFNDNHRTIVQIAHPLGGLFAFLDDLDLDFLIRKNRWFQGIRQIVDIKYIDALDWATLLKL